MSLNMDADGEVLIKGAQGITGTPPVSYTHLTLPTTNFV